MNNSGYKILQLQQKTGIKSGFNVAAKQYDNVFFDGDFDGADLKTIVCAVQCPSCAANQLRIGISEFLGKKLQSLISSGVFTEEEIIANGIAQRYSFGDYVNYTTKLGGTAEYVAIECGACGNHLLIITSVRETQPARYMAALNGVWTTT